MGTKVKINSRLHPKFLRWAGSKQALLPTLVQHVHPFKRYIEPFCGSCALFFALQPATAVLSDSNPLLIQTLKAVRSAPEKIFKRLVRMDWSQKYYYDLRPRAFSTKDNIELAANFIFLNANCFNGIFRLNRKGNFNVPYAANGAGKCPSLESLELASKFLAKARLTSEDFETVVRQNVRSGDFIFMDPPFALRNRRIFFQYRYDDFGLRDIDRLAKLLRYIDRKGAQFLLSYASSEEAKTISKGWKTSSVLRTGNIGGFVDRRRHSKETIITNG